MKVKEWICFMLLITFLVITPFCIKDKLPDSSLIFKTNEYKGVVVVWHIESFEGGMGSRHSWLKSKARQFEKNHTGVYVEVLRFSPVEAIDLIKKGQSFDAISFPHSLGKELESFLSEYQGKMTALDCYSRSGEKNIKQLAVPYMAGGYAFITKTKIFDEFANGDILSLPFKEIPKTKTRQQSLLNPIVWGKNDNNPLMALRSLGYSQIEVDELSKKQPNQEFTQYQAYQEFINNRTACLLGTQRDISRLNNRIKQGKFDELSLKAVNGFTDLVQYVGINSQSKNTQLSTLYIEFLLSEQVQKSLVDIEMYNVCGLNVYSATYHKELEKALNDNPIIPPLFS